MARPTKYSEQRADRIVSALASGLTETDAALVAGICRDTLSVWKRRYPSFADRISRAIAMRADTWLGYVAAAAPTDWRAATELLDRCAPSYRKRAVVEADITVMVRQSAERLGLSADEERALFDRIKDLLASARTEAKS